MAETFTTWEDMGVAVVAVEVSAEGDDRTPEGYVNVLLAVSDGPVFRARLAAFEAAFTAWSEIRGSDGRPVGAPPAQPAEFLHDLGLELADDASTTYAFVSRQAGGSGTERAGSWKFAPAPPTNATVLMLSTTSGDRAALHIPAAGSSAPGPRPPAPVARAGTVPCASSDCTWAVWITSARAASSCPTGLLSGAAGTALACGPERWGAAKSGPPRTKAALDRVASQ